jgi:hypothetical protein
MLCTQAITAGQYKPIGHRIDHCPDAGQVSDGGLVKRWPHSSGRCMILSIFPKHKDPTKTSEALMTFLTRNGAFK